MSSGLFLCLSLRGPWLSRLSGDSILALLFYYPGLNHATYIWNRYKQCQIVHKPLEVVDNWGLCCLIHEGWFIYSLVIIGPKAHSACKQKSVCYKGIALKIQRAVDCSAKLAHQLRIPGSNPATLKLSCCWKYCLLLVPSGKMEFKLILFMQVTRTLVSIVLWKKYCSDFHQKCIKASKDDLSLQFKLRMSQILKAFVWVLHWLTKATNGSF